jgi:hypothetical protein
VGSVPIVDKKASKPGKFAMIDENDAPGASKFESYDSSAILSCSLWILSVMYLRDLRLSGDDTQC